MRKPGTTQSENERRLETACPFAHTLGLLGRRWRPAILWKVAHGAQRYGQLRRALPAVTDKMLAQELRTLVEARLLERDVADGSPPRTRYRLAPAGASLVPLLESLWSWGERDLRRRSDAA